MSRNPAATRSKILDSAEELVLASGFGGTSVEAVADAAGVTKGAYFHHFASKADLGHALVQRYAQRDSDHLDELLARAEHLSRDPLQQLLILVGLLEEDIAGLSDAPPGCLFAAYCYQAQLFDEETRDIISGAVRRWRDVLVHKLKDAATRHPPAFDVELESLADMLTVTVEGAFVLSRTLNDATLAAPALRHYRNYLELLFKRT